MVSSSEANEHTDILHVHQIFERLAEEDPEVPDMSMAEYLHCKGVNRVVTQLAQSFYANDFGCSLEQLGLRECIEEAQQWIYGDTYLILDRPLSSIIDYLSQGLQVLTVLLFECIVFRNIHRDKIKAFEHVPEN
jgi:hypothetical protein